MGYIRHNAVVITGWEVKELGEAHDKALEIFGKYEFEQLVSERISGVANGQQSFFIAPDGSKEGWDTSDKCDEARKEFLDWLCKQNSCEYVEIRFGGDDTKVEIIRDRDSDY